MNLALVPWSWVWPTLHDGFISALRAYSPSAMRALGRAVDPAMRVETLPSATRFGPPTMAVTFSRPEANDRG